MMNPAMNGTKGKKRIKNADKAKNIAGKRIDNAVQILGITISGTRQSQVLKKMWLQRKEMLHIATVNPEYVITAKNDSKFREVLDKTYTIADGWGIVWAAQILQLGPIERISGVWLAEQIVAHAAEVGEKVFLLGAQKGVAEQAAAKMSKKYPQLQIAWYEGAQSVQVEKNEEASMTIAKINGFEPDYLLVAYGSPFQDMWIEENREYLRVRVAVGVGGTFDEWAGRVAVAPAWIDRLGLKWLWRVAHEPWRWKRVMKVVTFGWQVGMSRLNQIS